MLWAALCMTANSGCQCPLGSKADIGACPRHVRFAPESGHPTQASDHRHARPDIDLRATSRVKRTIAWAIYRVSFEGETRAAAGGLVESGALVPRGSAAHDLAIARYRAGYSRDGSLHSRKTDGASHLMLASEC